MIVERKHISSWDSLPFLVKIGCCDDNDASIYPFAGDTYGDGIDSDCDGLDCETYSSTDVYYVACPELKT